MRGALYATAVLNALGAATFLPASDGLRAIGGLPADAHPLYLATLSSILLLFGVAYLWSAVTGRADRQFLAVAAAGKLLFFGVLAGYALAGAVPPSVALSGAPDLVLGLAFAGFLASTRVRA